MEHLPLSARMTWITVRSLGGRSSSSRAATGSASVWQTEGDLQTPHNMRLVVWRRKGIIFFKLARSDRVCS